MAETADSLHNSKIKNFEQKVLNQSFLDIRFYDRLADYLLECCHAEAKPNTLSLFSFLPLFILSFIVTGPSTIFFLLTIISIFIHQLLDIANKKQAFRLSQFTLAVYYIDHIFDALSCTCIILVICRLLQLPPGSTLTAIFFFGMLPFYTHHLAMYCNEYMTFSVVSATTEGFVLIKLLFLIATFYPSFFKIEVSQNIFLSQIFIGIAIIWLAVFLFHDLYVIVQGKRVIDAKSGTEESFPLKNLFVIFMIGYLTLEIISIEQNMLNDSIFFYLAFSILTILFTHLIGQLVLAYGYNESFKQISLPFLVTVGTLIIFYTALVFILRGNQYEALISKILFGVILALFFCIFMRQSRRTIHHINEVLKS